MLKVVMLKMTLGKMTLNDTWHNNKEGDTQHKQHLA
jgi:hypothetical protein